MGNTPSSNFKCSDSRKILAAYGIRPNKKLGQNFIIDPIFLSRIADAAEIKPEDVVVEIGAGLGALTRELSARSKQVIAVEFDTQLMPALDWSTGDLENVIVLYGDIMDMDIGTIARSGFYLVVANIPYNITSRLIRRLMEAPIPARRVVLTIQFEVAERILAVPGSMNLLALSVQVYGLPQIIARLPAEAFYPKPKVDSAIMRIDTYPVPRVEKELLPRFFRTAKAGFSQRRKQLKNALSGSLGMKGEDVVQWLEGAGIMPSARAQELDIEDWIRLAQVMPDVD
jgi:16S rRNA (adenine1518-N6/adenine1519-N6)-dimethyltransferase